MFDRLDAKGIAGIVLMIAGLAVVAYANPIVAAGVGLIIAGALLTVWGIVSGLISSLGFGGMMDGF